MRISEQLVKVIVTVVLLAACGQEDPVGGEIPGDEVDAGHVVAIDAAPDATPVPSIDAAPAPDAEPGAPDAEVPDAGPPPVSFSADLMPMVMTRCGGCHLKDALGAGGLSFGVSGQLTYLSLIDQPTHNVDVDCVNLKLVDSASADPAASSLYLKIAGDTCGTRMPKGSMAVPFGAAELDLWARWIAEGAQNN